VIFSSRFLGFLLRKTPLWHIFFTLENRFFPFLPSPSHPFPLLQMAARHIPSTSLSATTRQTSTNNLTGSTTGLTKDHRLLVKVIEAKGLSSDHTDTNCIIRIDSNVSTQVILHPPPLISPSCLHGFFGILVLVGSFGLMAVVFFNLSPFPFSFSISAANSAENDPPEFSYMTNQNFLP